MFSCLPSVRVLVEFSGSSMYLKIRVQDLRNYMRRLDSGIWNENCRESAKLLFVIYFLVYLVNLHTVFGTMNENEWCEGEFTMNKFMDTFFFICGGLMELILYNDVRSLKLCARSSLVLMKNKVWHWTLKMKIKLKLKKFKIYVHKIQNSNENNSNFENSKFEKFKKLKKFKIQIPKIQNLNSNNSKFKFETF